MQERAPGKAWHHNLRERNLSARGQPVSPANLGPPPAHAHEQESPVLKELRRFALKRMSDKLEDPSDDKQRRRIDPQPMKEDACNKHRNRSQYQRNPQRMARPIHG